MAKVAEIQEIPIPEVFYDEYVQKRMPLVMQGCTESLIRNPLSLEDISKVCSTQNGNSKVEVNRRSKGSFSPKHSEAVEMKLSELIHQISEGATDYYMTTQTIPLDEESGQPALTAFPVSLLLDKHMIPLRPQLLGNLVPMTINLWMGNSDQPTSSGLHHDFHDNLYILLKGRKSFKIAPPSSIHHLQMSGSPVKLHSNGRIVYEEQLDGCDMIRADGAVESVEELLRLEIRREVIESNLRNIPAIPKNETERTRLENELGQIEDQLLEFELGEPEDDHDNEGDQEEETDIFGGSTNSCGDTCSSYGDNALCSEKQGDSALKDTGAPTKRPKISNGLPPNFVVGAVPKAVRFIDVHMEKGDILYLPAGWFHEVYSTGENLALNYWCHPPDVEGCYVSPYVSQFWDRDWRRRHLETEVLSRRDKRPITLT